MFCGLWQRGERHLLHWRDRKQTPVAVDKVDPTSWKESWGQWAWRGLAGLTDLDCTPGSRDHLLFDIAISMSKSELKSSMGKLTDSFIPKFISSPIFSSTQLLKTEAYKLFLVFLLPSVSTLNPAQSFVNFISTIIWYWSTFHLYWDLCVSHHHHYSMECKDLLIGVLVSTFAPINNF